MKFTASKKEVILETDLCKVDITDLNVHHELSLCWSLKKELTEYMHFNAVVSTYPQTIFSLYKMITLFNSEEDTKLLLLNLK